MQEMKVLYIPDVAKIIGKSELATHKLVERGALPRGGKIGGRLAWERSQIEEWLRVQLGMTPPEDHSEKAAPALIRRRGRPPKN